MTTVARAVLEITTDASGVDSGIASLKGKVGTLATDLKGLAGTMGLAFTGAAVVGGIKNLIQGTFEYAENITDLSQRMEVSTDAAQRWKYAADQSGSSIDTVAKASSNLSKELAGGSKSVQESLKLAGLEFGAIRQMKPEDQFNATVAAIEKMPDPLSQVKVATELFGKAGIELLPAIRQGFSDVANSASIMSKQTIKDLDDAKQSWDNLGNSITIWSGKAISAIGNAGEAVGGWFYRMGVLISDGREGLRQYDQASADLAKSHDKAAAAAEKASEETRKKAAADAAGQASAQANSDAQRRLAEAFQKQVDVLTGKALAVEVKELAKQVAAAEKQGGLTAYQYEQLGKRLDEMREKGASLPNSLHSIWLEHERLNPSIKVTEDAYKGVAQAMKMVQSIPLGLAPPPLPLPVRPFTASEWKNVLNLGAIGPLMAAPGRVSATEFSQAFGAAMSDLPNVILGALEGGGSVGASISSSLGGVLFGAGSPLNGMLNKGLSSLATSIGGKFVANLATSLSSAIPGIGALVGPLLGKGLSALGGLIFKSNDTKKMREQFASDMGLTLSQLYDDLRKKFGAEGESLASKALNVIGRKDIAAQQAWFKEVEALYAKYKQDTDDAAGATEDAAEREAEAHKKVTDAIQEKIDTVQSEYDSVFKGIEDELNNPEYDEAGNRIYGVEEARGLARLEQLANEKAALQAQMEDAKKLQDETLADTAKKTLDTAGVIRTGIEEIFKEPFKITFDVPRVTLPGGGSFGGFGGTSSALPTSALLSRVTPMIVRPRVFLDGREVNRNQRWYQTQDLERG